MNKEDLVQFQEEILKSTRDIKASLMKNLDEKLNEIKSKYDYFEEYLKHITESNKSLANTVTSFQLNFDRLKEIENFKNKVDSMLITHEIRINNNNDEVSSMRIRFERALMDNLLVPGYIGPSSTYKNIGDYILHNISDISKIKNENDVMKNMLKDIKTKSDSSLKNMLNLTEALVKRCNDYTNAQIKEMKNLIYDKYKIIEEKAGEMKEIIDKYEEEEKNNLSTLDSFKLDIMTLLDVKNSDLKRSQDELLYSEINKNNTFIENLTKNILEDKLKLVENNIKNLENEISKLKLFNRNNNTSTSINKNNNEEKLNKNNSNQNLRKGKNDDILNKSLKNVKSMSAINKKMPKKTLEIQKNNMEKSLENILIEEIEKDNKRKKEEKEIPDIVLKYKEAKLLLLKNNQSQKIIKEIKTEKIKNNILNIKTLKKIENQEKCSESFNLLQKNENINEESTKKNINDINNKSENFISNINNKIKDDLTDENEENINLNNKNTTNDNNNNNKEIRNVMDELKIPKILEKRILSKDELEEIKLNKTNYKVSNHKSSSIQKNNKIFLSPKLNQRKNENNTLKKWKKNILNKKADMKNDKYFMVNLDLGQNNYTTNGATILANKKLLSNHITKVENSNSFSKLFNAKLAKNIFHVNGN